MEPNYGKLTGKFAELLAYIENGEELDSRITQPETHTCVSSASINTFLYNTRIAEPAIRAQERIPWCCMFVDVCEWYHDEVAAVGMYWDEIAQQHVVCAALFHSYLTHDTVVPPGCGNRPMPRS